MGLLRLLTNARVMAGNPLLASEAWRVRDLFRNDPRVGYIREPSGFDEQWRKTFNAGRVGPNFWTDAYLDSLCITANCRLVTFDRALAGVARDAELLP